MQSTDNRQLLWPSTTHARLLRRKCTVARYAKGTPGALLVSSFLTLARPSGLEDHETHSRDSQYSVIVSHDLEQTSRDASSVTQRESQVGRHTEHTERGREQKNKTHASFILVQVC